MNELGDRDLEYFRGGMLMSEMFSWRDSLPDQLASSVGIEKSQGGGPNMQAPGFNDGQ